MSKRTTAIAITVVLTILTIVATARAVTPSGNPVNPAARVIQRYLWSSSYFVAQKRAAVIKLLRTRPHLVKVRHQKGTLLYMVLRYTFGNGVMAQRAKEAARWLVARGADVNAAMSNGESLLVKFSMFFAKKAPMTFLIKNGANVNARDGDRRTPLHRLALLSEFDRKNRVKGKVRDTLALARMLIAARADVNAKDKWGRTPLATAAFLGNIQMCKLLIAHKADVNNIDLRGSSILASVKGRLTGRWAMNHEKARLPGVIALLKRQGAKVVEPDYQALLRRLRRRRRL